MIKFSQPYVSANSKKYALQALNSLHQQGDGPFSEQACQDISVILGSTSPVLLTTSCTHSLEMASLLIELKPGDEVILPSFTFTSAATAIVQFGGVPVFAEIEEHSGCIDTKKIEGLITTKTKAISWVNYAGNAPDLNQLKRLAGEFNCALIEDNAHGLGGMYEGLPLGKTGDISTNSFHATKNIQCGEGGAIVINKKEFIDRSYVIREKGTNRKAYLSGMAHKYQWMDQGSSYLLAETLAAVLTGNLQDFEIIQQNRLNMWDFYFKNLSDLFEKYGAQVLINNGKNVAHMFAIKMRDKETRNRLIMELNEHGIQATSHYEPLHLSQAGIKFGKYTSGLQITESFAERLIRLPLWSSDMSGVRSEIVEKVALCLSKIK